MAKGNGNTCRACLENRYTTHRPSGDCGDYNAQVSWNRLMRRLYDDAGASVRTVPVAPDYSTPAAVAARIRQGGTGNAVTVDTGFARIYRAFRKVAAPAPVRLADLHVSRWRVVRGSDGRYDLAPAFPVAA
jgi:hypothetical protein